MIPKTQTNVSKPSLGRKLKNISFKEKEFANVMMASGLGCIEAARKVFGWRCEPGSIEAKKAVELKRSPRVKNYMREMEEQAVREFEAEKLIKSDSDTINWDKIRKFAFDRLAEIRDNPNIKSQTRFNAIKALEKLSDPSGDVNLISKWLDILWRGATAHCPSCHSSFSLWKIKVDKLEEWRKKNDAAPVVETDDLLEKRMEILSRAELRKKPHPGQVKALSAPERSLAASGAARGGKLVHPDTPVITTKGWKKYKDLDYSDVLFNENGTPTRIIGFSEKCDFGDWYELEFDNGERIIAHENHEWTVHAYNYRSALRKRKGTIYYSNRKDRQNSKRYQPSLTKLFPSVLETKEIVKTLKVRNGSHTNYAIPISKPIHMDPQELPINPYVLGVWLGDGCSTNGLISAIEKEIFSGVSEFYAITIRKGGFYPLGLKVQLRQLDLLKNKHVPRIYLMGSIDQRLQLLRGLMDTDGYCATDGQCNFDNKNYKLIKAVRELCASLGIKTHLTSKIATLYGKDCGIVYRVTFMTLLPVFTIKRKLDRLPKKFKRYKPYHYIVAAKKVNQSEGRCIQVDSPSGLYLASKSLIPTHNSFLLGMLALLSFMIPGVEVWVLARIYDDARSEVDYLKKFLNTLFFPHYKDVIRENFDAKTGELTLMSNWGSELRIRSAKAKGSITGRELEMALVAEPGWVPEELYEELRSRMSSRLGRIVMLGTPKGYGGILGRMLNLTGRDPETRKIIRMSPEQRTIANGCPWNVSLCSFTMDPKDNPEYVRSELKAARMELMDEEYASEFEGLMSSAQGAKFPHIKPANLIKLPREVVGNCVFVLGVDQGPKNFAACLLGWDGKKVFAVKEYFENDLQTMKSHMEILRKQVPLWIRYAGGNPDDWKLTIFDADPPLINELEELNKESKPWPTEVTWRPKNTVGNIDINWRQETYEFVNSLSALSEPNIYFDAEFCDMLHDQVMRAQDRPLVTGKDGTGMGNSKGWVIHDPWRGDHVVDALMLGIYTILSTQLIKIAEAPKAKDAWEEHKAAFNFTRMREEQKELTGWMPKGGKSEDELYESQFGRRRPRQFLEGIRGYYENES
jgi:hypothetical protein